MGVVGVGAEQVPSPSSPWDDWGGGSGMRRKCRAVDAGEGLTPMLADVYE